MEEILCMPKFVDKRFVALFSKLDSDLVDERRIALSTLTPMVQEQFGNFAGFMNAIKNGDVRFDEKDFPNLASRSSRRADYLWWHHAAPITFRIVNALPIVGVVILLPLAVFEVSRASDEIRTEKDGKTTSRKYWRIASAAITALYAGVIYGGVSLYDHFIPHRPAAQNTNQTLECPQPK
jgi:hypothetical protein